MGRGWFSAGARASHDEKKFIYLIPINVRVDKGRIPQMLYFSVS